MSSNMWEICHVCAANLTLGLNQDKCMVLARMESYRDDGKLWRTQCEPENELQLPPCDSPFIMKMTKGGCKNFIYQNN